MSTSLSVFQYTIKITSTKFCQSTHQRKLRLKTATIKLSK